jgi:hypothetical protein
MTVAKGLFMTGVRAIVGLRKAGMSEISATSINQVVTGFEKDTLLNQDLVRIGSQVLGDQKNIAS